MDQPPKYHLRYPNPLYPEEPKATDEDQWTENEEIFQQNFVEETPPNCKFAIWTFALGFFAFLLPFGFLLVLALGVTALVRIHMSQGELGGTKKAIAGMVIGLVMLVVMNGVAMPLLCHELSEANKKTKVLGCTGNMQQILHAVSMYVIDNNNRMPGSLYDLREYLPERLYCPGTEGMNKDAYVLNSDFREKNYDAFENPSDTPVVICENHEVVILGMADGHVETVAKPDVAFQTQELLNEKVESVLADFWNAENAEHANLFTHPNSVMFLSNKEFKKYKKSYDTYRANDLYRKVPPKKEYCCCTDSYFHSHKLIYVVEKLASYRRNSDVMYVEYFLTVEEGNLKIIYMNWADKRPACDRSIWMRLPPDVIDFCRANPTQRVSFKRAMPWDSKKNSILDLVRTVR